MNRLHIGFILFLTLLMPSAACALNGREVFEKVHDVGQKGLDRKTEATMELYDRDGAKRTRTLTEYSRNASPEAYRVLVVFNSPYDLKGVGLLIHAHTFADRDLWAYFPEYKRVRRIPTSSQDDSFFGSDFSYDDFSGPMQLNDYSYHILREEAVDGKTCYVVEVTPKVRRKYSRFIAWVARDLWVYTKIVYYRDNEIYRAGSFRDIRTVNGIPTPFRLEMENLKTRHRTVLKVDGIRYHTAFRNELFTQRALERGGR